MVRLRLHPQEPRVDRPPPQSDSRGDFHGVYLAELSSYDERLPVDDHKHVNFAAWELLQAGQRVQPADVGCLPQPRHQAGRQLLPRQVQQLYLRLV